MKVSVNILVIIFLLLGNNLYCQFNINSNFCIASSVDLTTDDFIKSINKIFMEDGDTIWNKSISVKKGFYQKEVSLGKSEWNYEFNEKDKKILSSSGFFYQEQEKVREECQCIYDAQGRLKSYLISQKKKGKKTKNYRDDIFYLKGEDSIKYVGNFYSFIVSSKIVGGNLIRTVTDTLGNIKTVEEFNNNLKIFSKTFKNGTESISTHYFYDKNKRLKVEVNEGWDIYDFMVITGYKNYTYNEDGKLIKIEDFSRNSELFSVQLNTYNDKGLIIKEEIDYADDGKYKVYLYTYEYWN